jgi:hypothetical protein
MRWVGGFYRTGDRRGLKRDLIFSGDKINKLTRAKDTRTSTLTLDLEGLAFTLPVQQSILHLWIDLHYREGRMGQEIGRGIGCTQPAC